MRIISLPAVHKTVSLAAYCAAIRKAKANPEAQFSHTLAHWAPGTGALIIEEFHQGIQDRINRHDPRTTAPWRKLSDQWYWDAWHTARRVNTPRLIVRAPEVPKDLRAHLAHRLHTEQED